MAANDALTLALVPLGRAIVDRDFEATEAARLKWRLDTRTRSRPRAYTYTRAEGRTRKIYLERWVTQAPKGKFIRFLNRNTLDCRKANLKIVGFRRDIFVPDRERLQRWELEESISFQINSQRRREDAWRMWCEDQDVQEIAGQLRVEAQVIRSDIRAMANNPHAASL